MQESAAMPSARQLRTVLHGEVIGPEDAAYDEARSVFYGIDRRPAMIVRPRDANEVAYIVSVARDTGSDLAVRSGGHSLAGHSVSDGGIVLDLTGRGENLREFLLRDRHDAAVAAKDDGATRGRALIES